MLRAEKLQWDMLQQNYIAAKADLTKMSEEKFVVVTHLSVAVEKITALDVHTLKSQRCSFFIGKIEKRADFFLHDLHDLMYQREKVELIGTLKTVSKEQEKLHNENALQRKKETAEFQEKFDDLHAQVLKLSENNTLLSADKIRYEQLQRDYEKLKSCGGGGVVGVGGMDFGGGGGMDFGVSSLAPSVSVGNTVDVDGISTQIVVQCSGHSNALDDAHRAQMQDLQEKNQLLSRLAGLHEAMEKIKYEPLGEYPKLSSSDDGDTRDTLRDTRGARDILRDTRDARDSRDSRDTRDTRDAHTFNNSVLDNSAISYASEGPAMPSGGNLFTHTVEKATSGIRWEGGPVDGLGWSSYYLRDKPRVLIEPLSTASPMVSPDVKRPMTAPVSSARDTVRDTDSSWHSARDRDAGRPPATAGYDGMSNGMSKGTTPGLGINNAGYHSAQAVTSDMQRRQLHFGDDPSAHRATQVASPRITCVCFCVYARTRIRVCVCGQLHFDDDPSVHRATQVASPRVMCVCVCWCVCLCARAHTCVCVCVWPASL